MAKSVHNDVLDGALNVLKTTGLRWTVCSAEPTTYTQAITTYELADVSATSSDYTIADGAVSGRRVTMAAKTGITIDVDGLGTHIAIVDSGASLLLYVTECSGTATLSAGLTCNFGSWYIEIADPA